MKKNIMLCMLEAAMLASLLPAASVSAESVNINNSVSGYISLSQGIKIAGADKSPVISIDEHDFDGVKIAAENMAKDIESVTGVKAQLTVSSAEQADTPLSADARITEMDLSGGTMTISGYESLTKEGRGIIAVYDSGGALKNVYFSDNTANSENGTLRFSQIPDIEGEKIKGFLWEDNGGLTCNPLADAFDYGSSGTGEADRESCDIIAGTLGSSAAIDELAEQNEIDVSEIKGEWEAFSVQQTSDDIIVIVGSDKRGTIYGIYDFCEKIGVSPWKWWADAEPTHADELYVDLPDGGYTEGASSVKYRGIFPNDEYLLNTWSNGDVAADMNTDKYEKIYELILRLKLNTLWPAMHHYSTAFHNIEGAAELAGKYGVVMGSSHAEPLLRNNLGELYAFQQDWISKNPDKPLTCKNSYGNNITDDDGHTVAYIWTDKDNSGNIVYNKEFLTDYWRESVRKYGKYENIYTLGMRGVHDG